MLEQRDAVNCVFVICVCAYNWNQTDLSGTEVAEVAVAWAATLFGKEDITIVKSEETDMLHIPDMHI